MTSFESTPNAAKAAASTILSMDERTREDIQGCEWKDEACSGGFPCHGELKEYVTEVQTRMVLCDVHATQYVAIMQQIGIKTVRVDERVLKCQRCGRKVIVVRRNYGSIHQMYFRHGEYITTPESKSEFDYHKPEIEVR